MHHPARWNGDPDCGHLVMHPFQTHYCTYVRAPKLLALQKPHNHHPDEILAILVLQAIELWLKVIENDGKAALAALEIDGPITYEPTNLLHRASTLIRLLDRHSDLAESALLNDLRLRIPLADPPETWLSAQLFQLERLTTDLEQRISSPKGEDQPHARAGLAYIGLFRSWADRYQRLLADLFARGRAQAVPFEEYLALDTLLDLHQGVKGEWAPVGQAPQAAVATDDLGPDELLFIVVHQVFELWFRVLLHELDATLAILLSDLPDVPAASRHMRRVVRTQKLLADMIHIPATMLPLDFLKFRSQTRTVEGVTFERGLSPASGTESYQFRELEILAGLKSNASYHAFLHGNPQMFTRFLTPAQAERLQKPSLPDAFQRVLRSRGMPDVLAIYSPAASPNPQADLAELADLLLEFDKFFQLWRMNHLTMVQSMIGRKSGTGFLGPEYLKETVGMGMQDEDERVLPTPQVRPRFFEDLWDARTRLAAHQRTSPPELERGEANE